MSINYSIAMLGNPIDEDAPKKAYAKSQYTNILTLDKFAGHIASHGSKYNRADIYAVLMQTVDCMREMLLEGKRIEHFMYQGRMPVPIFPVHKIGVDADLVNDLFFLPVPSPTVGGEKAERPTVTGHIHDTFRKLTVKNCVVVKLIQVVQRLKLDRRYHKPFVFQSECKDTDIFVRSGGQSSDHRWK